MAPVHAWTAASLLVVSLSVAIGDGCKKLRGGADTDGASSASSTQVPAQPVVESGAKSFRPLIRDCLARAVVFDVGGRAAVMLSRAENPADPQSPLTLTYATWDKNTATWTSEPLASITARTWVYEVTAEGTVDSFRLRLVHGDAAVKEVGGHRSFFSVSRDGTVPTLAITKSGGVWSALPIEWKPGPLPADDSAMTSLPVSPSPTNAGKSRKASAVEREQTKVLTRAPGCLFFSESAMTAPPGWIYGHTSGPKCKTPMAIALHDLGADRAESFTWPAKKDAPQTIAVRVLGGDTYVILLKAGASVTAPRVDKLFKMVSSKPVAMSLPHDEILADLWRRGDELRVSGAAHMWRSKGSSWESFGPGGCHATDESSQVQTYACTGDGGTHSVMNVDGTFVVLPSTTDPCSPVVGHETSLLSCGSEIVQMENGKASEPQTLPAGDGSDENVVLAGGDVWAARGNNDGRTSVFRLGSVGGSYTCTQSGPIKLVPYAAEDASVATTGDASRSP